MNKQHRKTPKPIQGFAFVGNPLDVQCILPFKLAENLTLNRASTRQRRLIKRYLQSLGGHCRNTEASECTFSELEEEAIGDWPVFSYDSRRLPSKHWRYYVVDFTSSKFTVENGCEEIRNLRAASYLTTQPLRLNPVHFVGGWTSEFTSDWEYFTGISSNGGEILPCQPTYLSELQNCYESISKLKSGHPDLVRSIMMYHDLPNRTGYNELTTLGLFAVLESLLTHSPRGEYDSIGHQIRKKVQLVDKRLRTRIDYTCFGQGEPDTIWSKLYEFRSQIAHGGMSDFDKGLSLLDSAFTVETFLKTSVRNLLRGAADEPDLYTDLRSV